jgi:hypothetical protein
MKNKPFILRGPLDVIKIEKLPFFCDNPRKSVDKTKQLF